MVTTGTGQGNAQARIKGKNTWLATGIAGVKIKDSPIQAIPIGDGYGVSTWNDLCKTTVSQKGANLLGKTFHYIDSWNTEGGQKCSTATFTQLIAASCGGAGGIGIAANMAIKEKTLVTNATGVIFQGFGQKYLFPNFHPADHNNQLAPPISARLVYTPPGAIYNPPPDPLAPPSDGYTGCTSISATGLNNGAPTWICWCNGEYTWSAPIQITDTLDAITKAHGGCDPIAIPPVADGYHPIYYGTSWERNLGEEFGIEAGHISHPYHGVRATIGVSPISGLSNIYKSVLQFNNDTLLSRVNSWVFTYIKMHFNDGAYQPTRYLGIYQGYNNTTKLLYLGGYQTTDPLETFTDHIEFNDIFYNRNLSPTIGNSTYAALELYDSYNLQYIPMNARWNGTLISGGGKTAADITDPFLSSLNGADFVEVGVIFNKVWPDNFSVNNHDILNMFYYIDNAPLLGHDWDNLLEEVYDALHQKKSRLRHNDTFVGVPWMCVDEFQNNARRISANYNRCNCKC